MFIGIGMSDYPRQAQIMALDFGLPVNLQDGTSNSIPCRSPPVTDNTQDRRAKASQHALAKEQV